MTKIRKTDGRVSGVMEQEQGRDGTAQQAITTCAGDSNGCLRIAPPAIARAKSSRR